ncbi:MAG: hypothetical protein A2138_23545 [Deltaproteobacteria bacterium RBG_16_71_12]|nr:MAG: hypothetical protein A2138_23545 [Deltaproteobacteria bacterium RBG_16_71_12]
MSFDPSLVMRVVQNLLGNAARYVGRRGVVEVAVRAVDDACVVTVGNDGPAIPKDQQATLFDQFGQVTDGQTVGNRGLGLYFCRLVAERHRGTITVRDRDGGGVCFDVALPALVTPALTARAPSS